MEVPEELLTRENQIALGQQFVDAVRSAGPPLDPEELDGLYFEAIAASQFDRAPSDFTQMVLRKEDYKDFRRSFGRTNPVPELPPDVVRSHNRGADTQQLLLRSHQQSCLDVARALYEVGRAIDSGDDEYMQEAFATACWITRRSYCFANDVRVRLLTRGTGVVNADAKPETLPLLSSKNLQQMKEAKTEHQLIDRLRFQTHAPRPMFFRGSRGRFQGRGRGRPSFFRGSFRPGSRGRGFQQPRPAPPQQQQQQQH